MTLAIRTRCGIIGTREYWTVRASIVLQAEWGAKPRESVTVMLPREAKSDLLRAVPCLAITGAERTIRLYAGGCFPCGHIDGCAVFCLCLLFFWERAAARKRNSLTIGSQDRLRVPLRRYLAHPAGRLLFGNQQASGLSVSVRQITLLQELTGNEARRNI